MLHARLATSPACLDSTEPARTNGRPASALLPLGAGPVWRLAGAVGTVVAATVAMLSLGRLTRRLRFRVSARPAVDQQAKYQAGLLAIAALVAGVSYLSAPATFALFFGVGDLDAPAAGVPAFGIGDGESWRSVGGSLAFFVTAATALFVFFQLRSAGAGWRAVAAVLPWVLAFSATNAFAEEVVFRLGVIVPLYGHLGTSALLLLSAALFGLPHLRGMPNGLVGVVMAGVLGWLLAKAVVETQGLGWAFGLHFLQDVVIFAGLLAIPGKAETATSERTEPNGAG